MKWIIAVVMLACELVMGQEEFAMPYGLIAEWLKPGSFNTSFCSDAISGIRGTGTAITATSSGKMFSPYFNTTTACYSMGQQDKIHVQKMTITAWIKWSGSGFASVFQESDNIYNYCSLGLWVYPNKLQFYHTNGWYERSNIYPTFASGAWIFAAVTRGNSAVIAMYFNGVAYPVTVDLAGGGAKGLNLVSQPWYIGNTPSSGYTFNGQIGRVQLYNRDLSQPEIMAIYLATMGDYK
jgi:hypothetical protein